MKSVLVGNGINIQFGGKAYSSDFIIKRIVFNALANKYDDLFKGEITGKEVEKIFRGFIDIANDAIEGKYDYINTLDEQKALVDFKERYERPISKYYEIMLEDWFFLIRLFFISNKDTAAEWQSSKQGFEQMILDAIINDRRLDSLYFNIGKKVKQFFKRFDKIFTLNYDNNLEALTNKEVFHLHGNYSVLADKENPKTVEGFLRHQNGECIVINGYEHCFCNALLDYSGELKYKRIQNIDKCSEEMKHWLELHNKNLPEYEKQLDIIKDKNEYVYNYISTYVNNPRLEIGTNYHFEDLRTLTGELHIIGISPNNDAHIFRCINESKLDKIYFYSYENMNVQLTAKIPYEVRNVCNLWKELDVRKKTYNCSYHIPNDPKVDEFIELFNMLSFDPMPKDKIISELNSIPQFEVDKLCSIVNETLLKQKEEGNPRDEEELMLLFREISRIALREGVLPPTLYMMYILNFSK